MYIFANGQTSFDLDPATECDDEYWFPDDPEAPFKQPAGAPSTVAYLNCSLKLGEISSYAVRTIVCPGQPFQQEIR